LAVKNAIAKNESRKRHEEVEEKQPKYVKSEKKNEREREREREREKWDAVKFNYYYGGSSQTEKSGEKERGEEKREGSMGTVTVGYVTRCNCCLHINCL